MVLPWLREPGRELEDDITDMLTMGLEFGFNNWFEVGVEDVCTESKGSWEGLVLFSGVGREVERLARSCVLWDGWEEEGKPKNLLNWKQN